MSKKFTAAIGAAFAVVAAWLAGTLPTPDAVGAIGTIAVSYIAVEGAVDIARARTIIRAARGVARVAEAALGEAERVLDESGTAGAPTK